MHIHRTGSVPRAQKFLSRDNTKTDAGSAT
jgi:hypothetical protein